jgi:DNA-binding transcriptional MerR regulator
MDTQLITTAGVARRVRRSEGTVRYWVRTGRLTPTAVTESGVALYEPAAIERLAQKLDREEASR